MSLKSIYKGVEDEDRMVGFLPHCTFNLNARAASIDTPLHGFVPFTHVDHMHPDAIIAIAASRNSGELTKQIFGDEIGWLPWRRPGFQLGLDLEAFVKANPQCQGRGARKPWSVHLGERRQDLLRADARHHQQGDRLVCCADRGQDDLRRCRGAVACRLPSVAPSPRG